MLMMVNSDLGEKKETHLSRINHVDNMRHILLFPDSLAVQTDNDILCIDPQ